MRVADQFYDFHGNATRRRDVAAENKIDRWTPDSLQPQSTNFMRQRMRSSRYRNRGKRVQKQLMDAQGRLSNRLEEKFQGIGGNLGGEYREVSGNLERKYQGARNDLNQTHSSLSTSDLYRNAMQNFAERTKGMRKEIAEGGDIEKQIAAAKSLKQAGKNYRTGLRSVNRLDITQLQNAGQLSSDYLRGQSRLGQQYLQGQSRLGQQYLQGQSQLATSTMGEIGATRRQDIQTKGANLRAWRQARAQETTARIGAQSSIIDKLIGGDTQRDVARQRAASRMGVARIRADANNRNTRQRRWRD